MCMLKGVWILTGCLQDARLGDAAHGCGLCEPLGLTPQYIQCLLPSSPAPGSQSCPQWPTDNMQTG